MHAHTHSMSSKWGCSCFPRTHAHAQILRAYTFMCVNAQGYLDPMTEAYKGFTGFMGWIPSELDPIIGEMTDEQGAFKSFGRCTTQLDVAGHSMGAALATVRFGMCCTFLVRAFEIELRCVLVLRSQR